jgi:uncharacterized protein YybS (DUF2232 family)
LILLQRLTGNPLIAGSLAAMFLILPLLQLIVPLPIYLVALRLGIKAGALAGAVTILLCIGILGQLALSYVATLLVLIWFPLLAVWLIKGGWRPIQILGGGYFLALAMLTLFLLVSFLTGNGLMDQLLSHLMDSKELILGSMVESKEFDAKMVVGVEQGLDEMFRLFTFLSPALFVSTWFTVQVGNFLLVRHLLDRWQMPLMAKQDLSSLRVPFFLVWPLIACGMLAFLGSGLVQQFGINLVIFLATPYFFQGYSVVQKWFAHYKVSVFVRIIFYTLLMTWLALLLVVTVLGLFDTWVDFRNRLT